MKNCAKPHPSNALEPAGAASDATSLMRSRRYSAGSADASSGAPARLAMIPSATPPIARIGNSRLTPMARTICKPVASSMGSASMLEAVDNALKHGLAPQIPTRPIPAALQRRRYFRVRALPAPGGPDEEADAECDADGCERSLGDRVFQRLLDRTVSILRSAHHGAAAL